MQVVNGRRDLLLFRHLHSLVILYSFSSPHSFFILHSLISVLCIATVQILLDTLTTRSTTPSPVMANFNTPEPPEESTTPHPWAHLGAGAIATLTENAMQFRMSSKRATKSLTFTRSRESVKAQKDRYRQIAIFTTFYTKTLGKPFVSSAYYSRIPQLTDI